VFAGRASGTRFAVNGGMTAAPDPLLCALTGILGELFDHPSEAVDAGATLRGTLLLDSLDIADFAAAVNRRLGVRASPTTYESLRSLGAIRDFLVSHRGC
jgi:acyl carrier protein